MLIDWLSLRIPLVLLSDEVQELLRRCTGYISNCNADGVLLWKKPTLDFEKLRSDTAGLCFMVVGDGLQYYLQLGASPATLEHGHNLFGSLDIQHSANVLIRTASKCLSSIFPPIQKWQLRRIDITSNHLLHNLTQVEQALRELRKGDSSRQKTSVPKGTTVYWGAGSDILTAKAYAKGPQLLKLWKRNKVSNLTEEQLQLTNQVIRFELSLKGRWFRRHGDDWINFTPDFLIKKHEEFFSKVIGSLEITDMETLLKKLYEVCPTEGQALAAHRTWALIKAVGFETTKDSMPRSTFMRHQKYLRDAGLSHADIQGASITQFRKTTINFNQPILSWDDFKRAA